MKSLLLVVLALTSILTFASDKSCDLTIEGNMIDSRLQQVKKIVKDKGYDIVYGGSNSDYELNVFGESGEFQSGNCVHVMAALLDKNRGVVTHHEDIKKCGNFVIFKNWKSKIKKVLRDLPKCN